jgi:putative DNA primase/helicase
VVVDDVEVEHRRLFVKAKNNLSPDNNALSYMTGARKVGEDEETGEEIFAPYIIWGAEHVKVTATEAMQAEAEGGHSKHARNEASEFLQSRLAGGPVMADDLRDEAEANGISWRTLQRAKKELNIDTKKERGSTRGKWL